MVPLKVPQACRSSWSHSGAEANVPHQLAGQWCTPYSHFSGAALAPEHSGPSRSLNNSKLGEHWRCLTKRKILIYF